MDEAQRIVYGEVTAEQVDREGEVCHYESTKPYYQEINEEFSKATDGKSIMPLREMHQLSAVGAGKSIDFDDGEKKISMGFKVVDDAAWKKVAEGVYTGFSQGGDYVKKWKQGDVVFYTAKVGEVSLVDSPALPSARFEYIRADGTHELRKFAAPGLARLSEDDVHRIAEAVEKSLTKDAKTKRVGGKDLPSSAFAYVGDKDDTSTWKLPVHDAAHARNALARFNQTQGIPAGEKAKVKARIVSAAKKFGIEVSEEAKKLAAALEFLTGDGLKKGMYCVADLANVLDQLTWIRQYTESEREMEGDASTAPEDLGTVIEDLAQCFLDYADEEVRELLSTLTDKGAKAMTFEELQKKAKSVADHVEAAHAAHEKAAAHHEKMHKAHGELGDMHKAHAEHHAAIAEHLAKAKEACAGMDGKAVPADPSLTKNDPAPAPAPAASYTKQEVDDLVKAAVTDAIAKMQSAGSQPSLVVVPRAGQ
ncbi:MAG TPA: DUF6582 domain-containing protein, partial [Terriglobia bacterium]|nr:DUF6582 domain-containing protein [Terriglobia bacterium]